MNKTIIITGATSGIGKAIATQFAQQNYDIIITGRRTERLEELKATLQKDHNINVQIYEFDVRDKQATIDAVQQIMQHTSHIDVLVNNAGLASGFGSIEEGDTDDWDTMIDTNIKGLLYVTRQIAPFMKAQASGHIINLGSTAGKNVYRNGNVYCATKFAVNALSQAMRIDLLQYGIKVTAINPGMVETEFSLIRFHGDEQKAMKVYEDVIPLKPEDIADIVWYCAALPAHVCINDVTVTCLTQANGVYSIKETERVKPTV